MNVNIPPTPPSVCKNDKNMHISIRETEGSYVFRGTPSLYIERERDLSMYIYIYVYVYLYVYI